MIDGPVNSVVANGRDAKWRSAKVLLLDADKQSAATLARIVRAAAAEVMCHYSVAEVVQNPINYDIVIVNYDSFEVAEVEMALELFADFRASGRMLFCSQHVKRTELGHLLQERGLANFMARNDELDSEELLVTIQKIVRHDIFGIDKYFSWGAHAFDVGFRSSREIRTVLEDVRGLVGKVHIPLRLSETFLTVVDELATNAVYNAPRDEQKRARYASQNRNEEVLLEPQEEVKACFRFDGRRLGVSVTDQSGSLKSEEILGYLARCFKRESDQVEWKEGGAGIGLYQTYESLSHLIVNLDPGVCTEVIGLIDVRGSYRNFASRAKSFNIFIRTNADESSE